MRRCSYFSEFSSASFEHLFLTTSIRLHTGTLQIYWSFVSVSSNICVSLNCVAVSVLTHLPLELSYVKTHKPDPFCFCNCGSLTDLLCGNRATCHRHSEKVFAQVDSHGRRESCVGAYSRGLRNEQPEVPGALHDRWRRAYRPYREYH